MSLALESQKLGFKAVLVDEPEKNYSSSVAAGIFNPLTGRKIRKTWKAVEVFKKAHSFYSDVQDKTGRDFFYPRPLVRVFPNVKAANDWDAEEERDFADQSSPVFPTYLSADFGGVKVNKAGFLNIPEFLRAGREILGKNSFQIGRPVWEKNIEVKKSAIRWDQYRTKRLIFCEGPQGSNNPLFSWLPFSLTKGELLEIETVVALEETIYVKGIFLLPLSSFRAFAGATYEREDLSLDPTKSGLDSLVERLESLFKGEYRILNRKVGIRPTIRDRRPLLGLHPRNEQIGIFNGLGSKGVTLGPFFAETMARHLFADSELPAEANISRFFSFFED
jgi:glycine/D-amino acid oxidase-like deaminating enzyme